MGLVIIEKDELTGIIRDTVKEAVNELRNEGAAKRLYSINKVAKLIHRSHRFVKRAVDAGELRVNSSGLISEMELLRYIKGE